MDMKKILRNIGIMFIVFIICYNLPIGKARFDRAIIESFTLLKWYAREHVILCLVPAFFIAGAIAVFVSQASVMKYLGAKANKIIAYSVASVSGSILAVCSCTVLPLFTGIYRRGAGLGPATAFLYSGPAINVLAIILTARILGYQLGIARAVGAILFSVIIGIFMELIFREDIDKKGGLFVGEVEEARPMWQTVLYFLFMILILVFANWGKPVTNEGLWFEIYSHKWILVDIFSILLGISLVLWFGVKFLHMILAAIPVVIASFIFKNPMIPFGIGAVTLSIVLNFSGDDMKDWFYQTYDLSKMILPLLGIGVIIAGFCLGTPESTDGGIIPAKWISGMVGGNSLGSNLFASVAGAFMYFATLTEVPILQGLLANGMGKGPALALLLAGPALSLPNMLVIRSVMGTKKTVVYVALVVVMATISGMIFGNMV
jgi:uncharacterized membrane protein YraQ (UPF0718 family)